MCIRDSGKSGDSFVYVARDGDSRAKSAGEIAFGYEVRQQFEPGESRKGVDAEQAEVLFVTLRGAHKTVRQQWRAGQPWPAHSSNGVIAAELIRIIPVSK